jgi:UDP-N-acetylglucosamine transferase subunit ALG13
MILVTVGTQMPFDRLVRTIDEWVGRNRHVEAFAQIGRSTYQPSRIQWVREMDPPDFERRIRAASAVVAHAGMGTIIRAWELGKPILVMPRRAELGEHRNDHQVATARRLQAQGRIAVAFDEADLVRQLDSLGHLRPSDRITGHASPELIRALAAFVQGIGVDAGTPPPGPTPPLSTREQS